jgi:hypothetical protein
LERGVVAPSSTKEQLIVLAKQDYSKIQKSAASASDAASANAQSAASSVYSAASSIESAVREYVDSGASKVYALTDLYYPALSSASSLASSVSSQASKSASSASKAATSAASSVSKAVPTDASSLSYEPLPKRPATPKRLSTMLATMSTAHGTRASSTSS